MFSRELFVVIFITLGNVEVRNEEEVRLTPSLSNAGLQIKGCVLGYC